MFEGTREETILEGNKSRNQIENWEPRESECFFGDLDQKRQRGRANA